MATRAAREPAPVAPVGRVCVDVPLPHLDRPFDSRVPADLDAAGRRGVRVRIRFAGQLVDGYLLSRVDASEHLGGLAFLDRVVSAEPVLSAEVLDLARAVAQRYAGTLADVLRLAVPPRHARAEASSWDAPAGAASLPDPAPWAPYPAGPGYLAALADGRAPRAVWTALPGEDWPARLAEAVASTVHSGRRAGVALAHAPDPDRLGPGVRETVRVHAPAVTPTADNPRDQSAARLPSLAWRAARDALAAGAPVLVQVPRRGYLPSVACAECRTPARCPTCHGPLALRSAGGTPALPVCGPAAGGL